MEPFDPKGGTIFSCLIHSENTVVISTANKNLRLLVEDPRSFDFKKNAPIPQAMAQVMEMRSLVQRELKGAKASNIEPYGKNLLALAKGGEGDVPPCHLWCPQQLPYEGSPGEVGRIWIPFDCPLIPYDGDTQIAARFWAQSWDASFGMDRVLLKLTHGRSSKWARQSFSMLNTYGTRHTSSQRYDMDQSDPIVQVLDVIETEVPWFASHIDRQGRSRKGAKSSSALTLPFTLSVFRQAAKAFVFGTRAFGNGKKQSAEIPAEQLPVVKAAAVEWFRDLVETYGSLMTNSSTMLSVPDILGALAALGHPLTKMPNADARAVKRQELLSTVANVRWEKGNAWSGIVGYALHDGGYQLQGTGSGGSYKKAYAALSDESSTGWSRVRGINDSTPAIAQGF